MPTKKSGKFRGRAVGSWGTGANIASFLVVEMERKDWKSCSTVQMLTCSMPMALNLSHEKTESSRMGGGVQGVLRNRGDRVGIVCLRWLLDAHVLTHPRAVSTPVSRHIRGLDALPLFFFFSDYLGIHNPLDIRKTQLEPDDYIHTRLGQLFIFCDWLATQRGSQAGPSWVGHWRFFIASDSVESMRSEGATCNTLRCLFSLG